MNVNNITEARKNSPYSGGITREQFLFYEMRITARLMLQGLSDEQIIQSVQADNLYQYPTEKSLKKIAGGCLRRLHTLDDKTLLAAIGSQPTPVAKQICLYAMMKHNRLVWDFMITVIGDKYQTANKSFGKIDVNTFLNRLQEQDEGVATWSEATLTKVKQVLIKILVENGYLESTKSTTLNAVLISPILEHSIKTNGDRMALKAFNCFT